MNERKQHIPVPEFDNKDTQGVLAALYRAARRAHRVAHQHGTGVVVMREGKGRYDRAGSGDVRGGCKTTVNWH